MCIYIDIFAPMSGIGLVVCFLAGKFDDRLFPFLLCCPGWEVGVVGYFCYCFLCVMPVSD